MVSDLLYAPHPQRAGNSVHAADVSTRIKRFGQAALLRGRCAHRLDYIPLVAQSSISSISGWEAGNPSSMRDCLIACMSLVEISHISRTGWSSSCSSAATAAILSFSAALWHFLEILTTAS